MGLLYKTNMGLLYKTNMGLSWACYVKSACPSSHYSPSPSSETSTMSTFILCVTFFLLGFVCVSMLYNGNRLSVHVVNRWIVSLKEEDDKDVEAAPEPANRNHGRHGPRPSTPRVPRPSTPRVPRSPTCVPRSLRPSRPPVPGCQYEPFQYKIDLRDKDVLKGIKTITFTMDLYPYAARPKIKCPSVLFEMSESRARRISICKSTLSSYDFTIDSLRQALSKKGKAYHDVDHPVMLKFEYRSERNMVYTTSLLVYHANTYCVCFRACDKWRSFDDSPYELKDQNGNLAENIHLNSAYLPGVFDYVGAITIIEALKCLNTDLGIRSKRPWKKACLHLVYCFIEASKFRDIEHYVRGALEKSMMEDLYASKVPTSLMCQSYVNSWGNFSDALLDFDEYGEFTLSNREKKLYKITSDEAEQDAVEQATLARFLVPVRQR